VIKPIYGAASIGVVKVTTLEELKATYTRVNKEMAGARIVAGAITTGEEADG
jgi:carnosine synthase